MAEHHDSGRPMQGWTEVTAEVGYHKFDTHTRRLSIRNEGNGTLFLSFDKENWFPLASGTSYEDPVNAPGVWHRTQTGRTYLAVMGIQLTRMHGQAPLLAP